MHLFPLIISFIITLSTLLEFHGTAHEPLFLLEVLGFHVNEWKAWALCGTVAIVVSTKAAFPTTAE